MGQQEVYDFLCKNKDKWLTSRQIADTLKISIGSVTMSLKKLRKTQIIRYKNTGKRNTFIYCVESMKVVKPKAPAKKKSAKAKAVPQKKVAKKASKKTSSTSKKKVSSAKAKKKK